MANIARISLRIILLLAVSLVVDAMCWRFPTLVSKWQRSRFPAQCQQIRSGMTDKQVFALLSSADSIYLVEASPANVMFVQDKVRCIVTLGEQPLRVSGVRMEQKTVDFSPEEQFSRHDH
jgi:hypothetical protein